MAQNVRISLTELFNVLYSSTQFSFFLSAPSFSLFHNFLNMLNINFSLFLVSFSNQNYNSTNIYNSGVVNMSNKGNLGLTDIFTENSTSQRVTRFNTVFVNYDYKTGHYLGNWDSLYPFLLNSFTEVAKGVKKPC